jgi:hypothetical protein
VTEDKQVDLSLLSDEGLEVSVILSSDNQGSLDVQNDETVVGKSLGFGTISWLVHAFLRNCFISTTIQLVQISDLHHLGAF